MDMVPDFEDLLALLRQHRVRYLVIGGGRFERSRRSDGPRRAALLRAAGRGDSGEPAAAWHRPTPARPHGPAASATRRANCASGMTCVSLPIRYDSSPG